MCLRLTISGGDLAPSWGAEKIFADQDFLMIVFPFSRPKFLMTFFWSLPRFSDFPFLFPDFLYLYVVYGFAPGPMVSPSQKRILVILSLGCFLKRFIVRDFLVWGLPGFLTYLRFVYIFANSLYSKFY